jgi:hypothetical protein
MAFSKKATTNTAFTKNTDDIFSIYTAINPDYEQMMNLMNNSVVTEINQISTSYASGHFETIKNALTQETYNDYSTRLYNLKKPSNPDYEKIRKIINTNLEGLLQSVNLYTINTDVTGERNFYKTKADMLNDIDSLISQLNMLRGSISLFPEQNITIMPVELKPEYLAYIKTYGYPENGIWDPDILAAILASIVPIG